MNSTKINNNNYIKIEALEINSNLTQGLIKTNKFNKDKILTKIITCKHSLLKTWQLVLLHFLTSSTHLMLLVHSTNSHLVSLVVMGLEDISK